MNEPLPLVSKLAKGNYLRKYGMLTAFLLICLVLSLLTPGFFSIQNTTIILRQVSINGILAIGVFAVLVILALISFVMDRLLGVFERRALRWQ